MTSNEITITGNFDGGNPKTPDAISQTALEAFTIKPFSEDGDANYKFRLDIVATNRTADVKQIKLTIDWDEPVYQHERDYIYMKSEEDHEWRYAPCYIDATSTKCNLDLPPGETYLCMHPNYGYHDYLELIASITPNAIIKKNLIGVTAEDREIWCLRFRKDDKKPRKRLLVVSRVHPYETAGSYCALGIIELFKAPPGEKARRLLDVFDLYLIPMANPDGVYHGFGKLTAISGIDLSKQVELTDKTCRVLKESIDNIMPDMYIEFHNWMYKDIDGIYYLNFFQSRKFIRRMPAQKRSNKTWRPMLRKRVISFPPQGFKEYCKDKFNATVACFEYPWFDRMTSDMEKIGVDTLLALSYL